MVNKEAANKFKKAMVDLSKYLVEHSDEVADPELFAILVALAENNQAFISLTIELGKFLAFSEVKREIKDKLEVYNFD